MHEISLSAIGADRPGIVAALTGVLADMDCSIEDSEMAVLRGHFAVMLVLSAPDELTSTEIELALAAPASDLGLVVVARPLSMPRSAPVSPGRLGRFPEAPTGVRASISVHGADRPGIVHGITEVLAGADVNIVQLRTHVGGDPANPLYAMIMDVAFPAAGDLDEVRAALEFAADRLGVEVTVNPVDDDIL